MKKSALKLRMILIVLSLLAFFSVVTGGYLYYYSLRDAAFKDAHRQATLRADTIRDHLSSLLFEHLKSVRALAGLKEIRQVLSSPDNGALARVNSRLDHFNDALGTNVCYLMDFEGNTIASSNRDAADSFVGKNYAFRPYFQQAIQNQPAIYMAVGITSNRPGVYYSHPVYVETGDSPIGVLVIKAGIDALEKDFIQPHDGIVTLTNPKGMIFISNHMNWLYHFLWKPSPEDVSQVARSRQFGAGPWNWTGLQIKDRNHVIDLSGNEYVIYRTRIDPYPGWNVIYLYRVEVISKKVSVPFIKMTGFVILIICLFTGVFVFFLYTKANHHIAQRKIAEAALRQSEETALALLNAPTEGALLLDKTGTILALNKTAAHRFDKSVKDMIGLCLFDLFNPDIAENRKAHHDWTVRSGKPFRYEDNRESRCFDTNIYPVFNADGQVVRVAIFSRDITLQKQTEEELKLAKEELTRYSQNLEKQVRKRTSEIIGILKHTPAVVYIKDKKGRFTLINSKFEELFGIRGDQARGKTAYDIFPRQIAEKFQASDTQVLARGLPTQEEVPVSQPDGMHIYFSVKFPLYDDEGFVRGLCGISTDITALKKAADQLRRLSGSIMNGQEKERTAIARELHDELGQMLTALRMDSVWLKKRLKDNDPKAAERALTMLDLIDKGIDELRGMAIRLRPGVLDDLGLIAALDWYTSDFQKRTGINCRFRHRNVPNLDDILATAAYRITQEALTNVARHSKADYAIVALQTLDGVLILSIMDNGRGFNTQEISNSDRLGIVGMRERATLVDGSLEIRSKPEKGTVVHFRVPIQTSDGAGQ